MIIIKLIGGLGNQMFQYAAGRAVSLERKTDLKLDISNFDKEGIPRREYALGIFNIQEDFATQQEIRARKLPDNIFVQKSPRLRRFLARRSKTYVNEIFCAGEIPPDRDDIYLDGYWQSEDYFKEFGGVIRQDFTFKKNISDGGAKWQRIIRTANSVSIHVRRTDYVVSGRGIVGCSLKYYRRAVDYMIKNIKPRPVFYVFSDDLEWCKKHLRFPDYEFNYLSGADDLRLMSQCKYNIIANSSFSWWGAWLNGNPKKIVIAPEPFLERPLNTIHKIVPDEWIKLSKIC